MKKLILVLLFCCSGTVFANDKPLDIIVRPTDLDVNAHVNNAKYVEYLQWGRWKWFEQNEMHRLFFRTITAVPVVAHLEIDYQYPCVEGDNLSVVTTIEKFGEKSIKFKQKIVREDRIVAAEGVVILVLVDTDTHRSKPIPKEMHEKLSALALSSLQN